MSHQTTQALVDGIYNLVQESVSLALARAIGSDSITLEQAEKIKAEVMSSYQDFFSYDLLLSALSTARGESRRLGMNITINQIIHHFRIHDIELDTPVLDLVTKATQPTQNTPDPLDTIWLRR